MTRSFAQLALALCVLGSVARAAAERVDGSLGSACATSSDCAGDLECIRPDAALGTLGPSGGLCSIPCSTDAECEARAAGATCAVLPRRFCLEACVWGLQVGGDLDPNKCHGREDVACVSIVDDSGACVPLCTRDEQCGAGLFCNGQTNLCDPVPARGAPHGVYCDVDGAQDVCLGRCFAGRCRQSCVIGSRTCPSRMGAPGAACLFSGGGGVGDVGACETLCNCSSDCDPSEVCDPRDFEGRYDAAGLCAHGPRPQGALDCLDRQTNAGARPGCAYGAIRACRTATCLGTAACLASGEYAECECLASSEPGTDAGRVEPDAAAPAMQSEAGDDSERDAAPPARGRASSGCACSVPRSSRSGMAWVWSIMIAVFAAQRSSRKRRTR